MAAARIDEAALARGRERWMLEAAGHDASLGGVLLDLGERRTVVSLRTRSGRVHTGRLEVVGADFVSLRSPQEAVLVPQRAVAVVRPAPGEDPVVGDRALRSEVRLLDVLAELAADRETVRLVVEGAEVLAGRLHGVGLDVLALRVDGERPATVHVAAAAITEVALR